MAITITDIKQAQDRIQDQVIRTPSRHSWRLSNDLKATVILKCENQQLTGSFKDRGALNKLRSLSQPQQQRGIIAMSAGNHAQAVAYRGRQLGIPTLVVMPDYTPMVKVEQVQRFGAEVIFHGESLTESIVYGRQIAQDRQLTIMHPYDDEWIIAGQGTVALEFLQDYPDLDVLLVPVGGGGLISGVAIAAQFLSPHIQVMGVQTQRYPAMKQALSHQPIICGHSTIAEGIAVKAPGTKALPIIQERVDDILLVDEEDIEEAIRLLLEADKTVVEGAGAAGVAALMKYRETFVGKKIGVILSGGNIDLLVLDAILKRSLFRTGRLVHLFVEVRDVPGALAMVTQCIGHSGANILEVHHHREFTNISLQSVEIELVILTRGKGHLLDIMSELNMKGCRVRWSQTDFSSSCPVACSF